ncbi:hypothetical protein BZB76_3897 [Actinomadura pelletieri DSM 43383]|uniref:Uncharacterized protein n=1 Tax=Actinomadura pelletieri DSM 43383 TaxID=1120940 RepID=A0A495QKT7_9ACTN|nr:hypothetical protein BZB76_3897 [Actinomadura pelletieri DSM 43383]
MGLRTWPIAVDTVGGRARVYAYRPMPGETAVTEPERTHGPIRRLAADRAGGA